MPHGNPRSRMTTLSTTSPACNEEPTGNRGTHNTVFHLRMKLGPFLATHADNNSEARRSHGRLCGSWTIAAHRNCMAKTPFTRDSRRQGRLLQSTGHAQHSILHVGGVNLAHSALLPGHLQRPLPVQTSQRQMRALGLNTLRTDMTAVRRS